ncbi:tail fiber assembly protein [Providencia sp. PROV212]|uniref:tail fiber assembly protein n=1 Tax=Providencia sp. PROV212 TaxID=2949909 RepID=UPI00234BCE5E|nr:tail fiber assembly protein [Providencia sp. PROV212]
MIHFKNKDNAVFAYTKSDLTQVERASELERLILEIEPTYSDVAEELQKASIELQEVLNQRNDARGRREDILINATDDVENVKESITKLDEEIAQLDLIIIDKQEQQSHAQIAFNTVQDEFEPLKNEYAEILPVFFDIREHLKALKKMTDKEVEAYINPPISKEQYIAEAEMQKQLCAEDAEKNITILERKMRLNMATADDKNSLTAWEIYSINIADIDTSLAPDINWPQKP